MVMRGYDTHQPVAQVLDAIKADCSMEMIPNLLPKDSNGSIRENEFSHKPKSFSCGIDWSRVPNEAISHHSLPILEMLSTQNGGAPITVDGAAVRRRHFGGFSSPSKT
jgi:clorobiocin/coumermycin A biosynthesis protein CloN6/CouN6